jgi:hypothetical protein
MGDSTAKAEPVDEVQSGLVDLSSLSFTDVLALNAEEAALEGTALGHALRRIVGDSEDVVSEFTSSLSSHVR